MPTVTVLQGARSVELKRALVRASPTRSSTPSGCRPTPSRSGFRRLRPTAGARAAR